MPRKGLTLFPAPCRNLAVGGRQEKNEEVTMRAIMVKGLSDEALIQQVVIRSARRRYRPHRNRAVRARASRPNWAWCGSTSGIDSSV